MLRKKLIKDAVLLSGFISIIKGLYSDLSWLWKNRESLIELLVNLWRWGSELSELLSLASDYAISGVPQHLLGGGTLEPYISIGERILLF